MKRNIPLFFLALCSCGSYEPNSSYMVYIDPAFSNSEAIEIGEALTEWQEATEKQGFPLHFSVASLAITCADGMDECTDTITIHPATAAQVKEMGKNSGINNFQDLGGITSYHWRSNVSGKNTEWANTYLSSDLSGDIRHKLIRHELGHAVGLYHTWTGTIMYANSDGEPDSITCTDAMQYGWRRGEAEHACNN